ncbi:MAG: hypothetical protein P1T08_11795 [Acidimicrobiia bacterium]|nr:hypothetical protein [Acidimicrobiia bacterium]
MAMITYAGNGFRLAVPRDWSRLANEQHIAAFLGRSVDGVRSSMTISRYRGSAIDAAGRAREDHVDRFDGHEVLHESSGCDSFYRRYAWAGPDGLRIIQHQLFAAGLVLTCSRVDSASTEGDEKMFVAAIRSLRVGSGQQTSSEREQLRPG